ncbi:hypothetical protein C2857_002330 [Epichloe festucae Fl1]|uniref:Gluconokinase n=1 Tax=Epichloe festucae (strain Fl1) TaxID=877507 RepID=A0A7S9KRR1_EPIFF|nr:hypothetical protein C2857_002330 [Epichloe festucae Fl1]
MLSYDSAIPNGQDKAASVPLPPAGARSMSSSASAAAPVNGQARGQRQHHLWLVTGPAGCGKTTVAEHLANALDIPYIEGDLYHPQANIDKMSAGIPLTDSDRWDWLTELRKQSNSRINNGADGVVVACSALKLKYRDVIRVAAYYDRTILIHFIFLHASQELLLQRVAERKGHYMGANMVKSQFDILERPREDEIDVITIDASQGAEEVKDDALAKVNAVLAADP